MAEPILKRVSVNYIEDLEQRCTFPVVCVVMSLLQVIAYEPYAAGNLSWLVYLSGCPSRWEVPRWILYTFAHSSVAHVLCNVFVLLFLGITLEPVHGSIPFLGVYVVSAVGAAVFHGVIWPNIGLVGSSGAVFGLLGARFGNILLNAESMPLLAFRFCILASLGTVGLLDYLINPSESVSYSCHAAGFVVGLVCSLWWFRNLNERRGEKLARWVLSIAFAVGFVYTIWSYISYC